MSLHYAAYKEIPRNVFNAVADRIQADVKLNIPITINYNGTALRGDVSIEGRGGATKEFKEALKIFNEEYCK